MDLPDDFAGVGGEQPAAAEHSDEQEQDEDDPAERETKGLPGRSLTELGADDSQDEGAGEGDANDDDDDEESEEDEDNDRPKKRKRRKKKNAGNHFLDIEAVDDDDEEEDDEAEEGFVATDDFIVNRPERRDADKDLAFDDVDYGDEVDGDASHRQLDQRRLAQKDREAEELAETLRKRYHNAKRYDPDAMEDWGPRQLLMPGVNDPSIWGIKCKIGRERDLVLSLSRKAAALAASDSAPPLRIISAFHRDSIKGYIYIEARSEENVRTAVDGLIGIYSHTPGGVFLVDIEEMPDLLKTKQKKVEINPGGWVRIKRGKYAGDLAQIIDTSENGEDVALKFIPRIDLTPKDEGVFVGSDGKKRKKGQATPLAFRPPQRFFNPEEIGKIYGKEVTKRPGSILVFRNDTYKDGYCEKDIKLSGLILEDVKPTIDELTRFLGDGKEGEGGSSGSLDLGTIAADARKSAKSTLQPGDHVEIFEGDQKGMYGTVKSIENDIVKMKPHVDLELDGLEIQARTSEVRKRFRPGDHVKVMTGSNADETGLVVAVKDDVVSFLSDLSMQEVTVFSKDVREAAEVGSGVNVIGQYELHDLVQLDTQTTGVIFKIERDMFRIIDQTGTVRMLKPSQIGIKANSRDTVATDQDGYDIKAGDEMKEVGVNNMREGRKGKVLHVYRSIFAFLFDRDTAENGGVFVTYARSLQSTAPKGAAARPASHQMNPDLAKAPAVAPAGASMRRDGRIHRKVSVCKGAFKGYAGVIKDVTANMARVELHTNSKVITINIESLKEQKPDGTLIPLLERPGGGPGYGARPGGPPSSHGGFSSGTNGSTLGSGGGYNNNNNGGNNGGAPSYGGRTPAPQFSGGRTPAPQFSGGRTPAYSGGRTPAPSGSGSGSGGAWDASGRTPMVQSGASAPAWNAGSRTPAVHNSGGSADAWNASSRTPHHPGGGGNDDAWNASSRTPHHPGSFNDGGRTPDPRAGGRTPAYGGRSSYAAPTPAPQEAPTPAAWDNDDWGAPTPGPTAPTPGPSRAYPSAPTPGAAPTPAAYSAPTPAPYPSAPTPAAYPSAPTPAAYGSAPTPGGYPSAPTPGAYYGAPTPGAPTPGYNSAPTPAAGVTPGYYAAPTPGMTPHGGYGGHVSQRRAPVASSDWTIPSLRVQFTQVFQGVAVHETGHIIISDNGVSTVVLDTSRKQVTNVPSSCIAPIKPSKAGETVLVIGGEHRGQTCKTVSRDGNDWMVDLHDGHAVLEDGALGLKA
ncbi:hypothetical protein RQP46_010358 [Phenoliferia psychrophenolica]